MVIGYFFLPNPATLNNSRHFEALGKLIMMLLSPKYEVYPKGTLHHSLHGCRYK